jgi:hypothetical protein
MGVEEERGRARAVQKLTVMHNGVDIRASKTSLGPFHGCMARGGLGLPEILLGLAMPDPSTPCGGPPLKWPYSCFRGGCPGGRWRAAVFYPLGYSTLYAFEPVFSFTSFFQKLLINEEAVIRDSNKSQAREPGWSWGGREGPGR